MYINLVKKYIYTIKKKVFLKNLPIYTIKRKIFLKNLFIRLLDYFIRLNCFFGLTLHFCKYTIINALIYYPIYYDTPKIYS